MISTPFLQEFDCETLGEETGNKRKKLWLCISWSSNRRGVQMVTSFSISEIYIQMGAKPDLDSLNTILKHMI